MLAERMYCAVLLGLGAGSASCRRQRQSKKKCVPSESPVGSEMLPAVLLVLWGRVVQAPAPAPEYDFLIGSPAIWQ
eukprot:1144261-Pelagomonas_calceolata.AAC.8